MSEQILFLTVRQAAERLGIKESTCRQLINRGIIPSLKLLGPRSTRVPAAALEEWARNAAHKPEST
ncbi:MAG TPA: helix-turn-helix domain-containing protein [Symbiobacteriaceae bacterium]|jgi:excisionase family DNA binding protein